MYSSVKLRNKGPPVTPAKQLPVKTIMIGSNGKTPYVVKTRRMPTNPFKKGTRGLTKIQKYWKKM